MKKLFLMLAIAAMMMSACNKEDCTTCVESITGTETSFCGDDDAVDFFKSEIIKLGISAGQSWTCN